MENGISMPAGNKQQVMVVIPLNNVLAQELTEQLRTAYFTVVVAHTIEVAAHADEYAVCLVFLDTEHWREYPAIATAIRCNPHYLIPIVTTPMTLPRGNWTTEEIVIKEPLSETAAEIGRIITPLLLQQVPSVSNRIALPTTHFARPKRKLGYRSKLFLEYGILAIIVILVIALLHFFSPTTSSMKIAGGNGFSLPSPYSVNVPGPQCDKTADWEVGENYKSIPTTTATGDSTKATPVVIQDSSTTATCQSDGLFVQHNEHFDSYATVYYANNDQPLADHFKTQITAKMVEGSDQAGFLLSVKGQPSTDDTNSGYGNDSIQVNADGSWLIQRVNDQTDQVDADLAQGFVAPAQAYTISSEVNGSLLTFWIGDKKVGSVVDTTYAQSYSIGFGMSDPGIKTPPSALYSHFSYDPLPPDSKQKTEITAVENQLLKDKQSAYSTQVPGFGCDTNGGQWQPTVPDRDSVSTKCLANGLSAFQPASAKYIGNISFYGRDGILPANYRMQTDIAFSNNNQESICAGLAARQNDQGSSYNFFICQDGYWQIVRYLATDGSNTKLDEGNINGSSNYTITASVEGPSLILNIDGKQISAVKDSDLSTTDYVSLAINSSEQNVSTVLFSNFVLTPLK